MNLKRTRWGLLPAVLGFCLTICPAQAQEPFSWTGFYIGGNLGGNWGDYSLSDSADDVTLQVPLKITRRIGVPGFDKSDGEFIGGGQLGYNYQIGAFVLGVEADFQGTSLGASKTSVVTTGVLPPFDELTAERKVETDWMSSARLRVGFGWHRFLFYATGGAALTEIKVHANDMYVPGNFSNSSSDENTSVGWTVGCGGEWAVSRAVSIGVEYRHSDFGSANYELDDANSTIVARPVNVDFTDDQVVLKVNVLFSGLFGGNGGSVSHQYPSGK